MKLYYTVASAQNDFQTKPSLSLGGYKSSTPLPNGVLGNLFSDISMYTVKNNFGNKYIGLILVNEDSEEHADVNFWFVYPTSCSSLFRVALVDLAVGDDGIPYMEHIPDNNSKPLYATFNEVDGEANKINIGTLASGEMLGIWIERELKIEDIKQEQSSIYVVDPNDPYRYNEVELSKEDDIEINFEW